MFESTLMKNNFNINVFLFWDYLKFIESDCVIICLYIDDMLIFGINMDVVNKNFLFFYLKLKI